MAGLERPSFLVKTQKISVTIEFYNITIIYGRPGYNQDEVGSRKGLQYVDRLPFVIRVFENTHILYRF